MSLYHELKRRNVFRVGAAYIVAAWLLIQVAETIFPLFGFDDKPARIAVIILAIGFPMFLLFSWVFEITPEGLKKEKDFDRWTSVAHKTGKQFDRIIIVLLAIALAYFAFDRWVVSPQRLATGLQEARQEGRNTALVESYGDKSVAVLPFVNMSSDSEQNYFSDGNSEELLNLLAKIPELRVISRTSAFKFKGKDINIPSIAKQLNVAHFLEGSVRKSGNKVRITAQLIEARSDTHLWSETYDRTLDDIFAIQDEIAAKVVAQLKVTLLGELPKVRETDLEAYDLYLRARFVAQARTPETMERSVSMIEEALDIDPLFAEGRGFLATLYFLQKAYATKTEEEEASLFELAERTAVEALVLDENQPGPRAVLAVRAMYKHEWQLAEQNFKRALAIAPNDSQVRRWYSRQLMWLGYLEEALLQAKAAQRLDPISAVSNGNLGYVFALLDEDAEAKKFAGIARELGLDYFYSSDIMVDLGNGRLADAAKAWTAGLEALGHDTEMVTMVVEASKRPEMISSTLEYLDALGQEVEPGRELALALLLLRQYEAYLSNLGGDWFFMLWCPLARPIRQLPSFQAEVTKAGMFEYWKERGWPDLCHPAGDGFVCD